MYAEDDYLLLSGIQHFLFCPRQWALIHLEQIWHDNGYTAEGQVLHKKADQPFLKEKRNGLIVSRAMAVSSKTLGLSGVLDVIEFVQSDEVVELKDRQGRWLPIIVEYKRGKKKKYEYDNVQLMAQAICIEEDFSIQMDYGYIYYAQTDSREKILFTAALRQLTRETAQKMHQIYTNKYIPAASYFRNCQLCSLYDECRPRLTKRSKSVSNYVYGADL